MPLTAHLEELRWRIVRALVALGIAFGGLLLVRRGAVPRSFLLPLASCGPDQTPVIGTGVAEAFFTKLKVSFIASIFLARPGDLPSGVALRRAGALREREAARPDPSRRRRRSSSSSARGSATCSCFPSAFRFFLQEYASIGVAPQLRISE
jgi:sec-independent protein translocase protein TatC